ncbi:MULTISPECIES: PTS transporter subunit EIIC [unclassified Streptomyces]|uniref:PTS transporter subunit EIIC n=1 Tax=unclassified Streptomyces TaxID=2593676 RepID=UPI00088AC511|nr:MULTISPECIES: PTS transporter subunit EIIC [unclassified Streptomyces]PBC84367.1 PTS system IIB component (Glc family) /PTS system IIC component (Glc family) [Streptomyces sp. 2321.6]SDR31790.1 PTS system IIB component, Glc family /PTS system IIC component, Glc family [Streptomyces sp. KS_16]SED28899.1 PTS system IIB component, Glc family /PTS system IIC component, Glc family [Streptomyces sp. 2133.1]SNC70450.1 PTS system, sucrose-specific IIC component [Streptomyces sp. 2114.4]
MTEDKNRATAAAILPLVGGAKNLTSIAHCMTRLRLGVRDRSLVRDEALKALPAVMGVVEDDTYQIVLGPGTVAHVTPEFERLVEQARTTDRGPEPRAGAPEAVTPEAGAPEAGAPEAVAPTAGPPAATPTATTAEELAAQGAALKARQKSRNATPVKLFLRRIANVFVPLIPALIGCGIVAGINGLLTNLGWLPSVVPALAAIASGFMSLIAVFVGFQTAKEFGGTPILGGAVAAIIVFPGIAHVTAFGQKLVPGQGGVLGALGAALLAVQVEKCCRNGVFPGRAKSRRRGRVPEALDVLLTPTLTVLVTGLVTIFGLMFVAGEVSTAIGTFATWLLAHGGAFAGFVLGGLFLPLVMLGLHQALIPIHTTLIEQQGYTVLLPILAMAGAGQVGAALAVYLRLPHNRSLRTTIKSALPAGFLGVGEPLIYGVSLPLGRPFITACIGGACGGGFIGLFNQLGDTVGSTAIGPSGWALFPLVKGAQPVTTTLVVYALGLAAGYLTGFLATYFFGFSKQLRADLNTDPDATAPTLSETDPATTGGSPAPPTPNMPDPPGASNALGTPPTSDTPTTPDTPTAPGSPAGLGTR